MKVSDYIVELLIEQGVSDVFGYPGGMVTHLMESFSSHSDRINAHVSYHEQAAAFEACGYAQTSGHVGVAYATSGPGATNLITGISNAYCDSIPVLFITGQVNTFESKGTSRIRQKGFQETNIIDMVQGITKYAHYVEKPEEIKACLKKAFYEATAGRPGPVLLDIPMNIQRSDVALEQLETFQKDEEVIVDVVNDIEVIREELWKVKRPVLLFGAGIKISHCEELLRQIACSTTIPMVSSMLAFDVLSSDIENYYGFIGAYGDRAANFIIAKSDLIISIGSRLDIRQVGGMRENFAPNAKLIRIDVDRDEFSNPVKPEEQQIYCPIEKLLPVLIKQKILSCECTEWSKVCNTIRDALTKEEVKLSNQLMKAMSEVIPDHTTIVTDVGQNQVWTAQSFHVQKNQSVIFSGGHGAMGYSLPAAIGAFYGTDSKVVSINGDGGLQMNIQELQFIVRERLPITVVVFNNHALGMIRHFQEMYFNYNYTQTIPTGGYDTPNFEKLAIAYGLQYYRVGSVTDFTNAMFNSGRPTFVEVEINEPTYVYPKLEFGKPNQDQEPLIDRALYNRLMEL